MAWFRRRRQPDDERDRPEPAGDILGDRDRLARAIGYDDRLSSGPGLRALFLGDRDDPENVEGPLFEVALWLEFLGEHERAARVFRVAADRARGWVPDKGPLRDVTAAQQVGRNLMTEGVYASLGGDADRAARVWRSAVELCESWVGLDPAEVWHQWVANAETADRDEPPPLENPPSPQSLKELCFSLAYARLRLGNDDEATDLLDREAQLRAAAPGAQWHHFYASTDGLQADLAVMVRELASAAPDRRVLDRAIERRLKRAAPYNLCEVLDLQRAYPEVMPEVFPPGDLLSLLAPKGRKELGLPLDSGIQARR